MERLYRGKRIDNGKWVYGWPYSLKPFSNVKEMEKRNHPLLGEVYILMLNLEWDVESQFNYLKDPKAFSHLSESVWKVYPDTVTEYIGREDINHEKIYRGDLVKVVVEQLFDEVEKVGEIEYCDELARYVIDFPEEGVTLDDVLVELYQIEKVGNEWDNPELLDSLVDEELDVNLRYKLTKEGLRKASPNSIMFLGEVVDGPGGINMWDTGKKLLWVVVKGAVVDWAVYVYYKYPNYPDSSSIPSYEKVRDFGNKVHGRHFIEKVLDFDDEVWELYRD